MSDIEIANAHNENARRRLNEYVGALREAGVQPSVLFVHRFEHWRKERLFKRAEPKKFASQHYSRLGYGWPLGRAIDGADHLFYVVDRGVYAAALRECPQFGTISGRGRTHTKTTGPTDMHQLADTDGNVWIIGQYEYAAADREAQSGTGIVGLQHNSLFTLEDAQLVSYLDALTRHYTRRDP